MKDYTFLKGVYKKSEGIWFSSTLILSSSVFKLPLHAASVPGSLHARPQAGLSDGAAAPRGGRPSVQTGRRSQGSQIRQRADGV